MGYHSLPGFLSSALTNLIAKHLSSLVEGLLSAKLVKETVVRVQQGKELGKFIRLCFLGVDTKWVQVIAHSQFPRLLEAYDCEGLVSDVRWCMGKNVAIAFPDTYQEHLLPLSTAVHSYAEQHQLA